MNVVLASGIARTIARPPRPPLGWLLFSGGMRSSTPTGPGPRRLRPGRQGLWSTLIAIVTGTGLGLVVGSACTLTLERTPSCGDGYTDEEAGEECDPGDLDSYINECVNTSRPDGDAACNPETCEIIKTLEQCAVCGDGRVDELLGEQCDGDELNGAACPGGVGTLQCSTACRFDTSACLPCGNGMLDPGEECDPRIDHGELTTRPPCMGLAAPDPNLPYMGGQAGACGDDCRWDRSGCNYCGNGQLDDENTDIDIDGSDLANSEWCDMNQLEPGALETATANSACTMANEDLRPVVECDSDCLGFVLVEPQSCCLKTGAACPIEGSVVRCCYEIDHVDDDPALEPCVQLLTPQQLPVEACR